MKDNINHQFGLFPHKDTKPKAKHPLTKEEIKKWNDLFKSGDEQTLLERMRDMNDKLDAYEKRITNGRKLKN